MAEPTTPTEDTLEQAKYAGPWKRFSIYFRQSGPGFLQSACTIGGGTLATSLFLGMVAGPAALWVQPVAIGFGLIALGMISHVTLSTGERPFRMINERVSPVLGWGWLIATIAANMVWGLPQYNLAAGALTENIAPNLLGAGSRIGLTGGTLVSVILMAGCAVAVVFFHHVGARGIRWFETIIKFVVASIVVCFAAVVLKLFLAGQADVAGMLRGYIPSFSLLTQPVPTYGPHLDACGETAAYWSGRIVDMQRNTVLAAIGASVGINMTFLMPYALLSRGWGRAHRGLARFDLVTGLALPFVLVTSCVIIAASFAFHDRADPSLTGFDFAAADGTSSTPALFAPYAENLRGAARFVDSSFDSMDPREQAARLGALTDADKHLAATLIKRGTHSLAAPLGELFGGAGGRVIFGVGVFFVALSTVIIHMVINGYAVCEALGREPTGRTWIVGSLLPLVAVCGPFVWGDIGPYIAVPTSVIGLILLPIALWGFFLIGINPRLGDDRLGPMGRAIGLTVAVGYTGLSAWAAHGKMGQALHGWFGTDPAIGGAVGIGLIVLFAIAAAATSPRWRR